MPDSSGGKLCPICDSPLQPGSRKCGFCGTDLSIFDMDMESSQKAPEPAPSTPEKPSIHAKVEEVLSRPPPVPEPVGAGEKPEPAPEPVVTAPVAVEPEPVVEPQPVEEPERVKEPEPVRKPVPVKEPEPAPGPKPAAKESAGVEFFECPQCGTHVETTANSCPKCGVLFAEEGADMFQCPACNALVSIDAKSCPGCGAMFVEPESAPAATGPAPETPTPVREVTPPPKQVEPEPIEEKPPPMKGLLGKLKFGRKEKPVEREAEVGPEPRPAPKPKTTVIRELREQPAARPAPAPERAPAVQPRRPPSAAPGPVSKDKGRELARMVAEMKPLLALARERDVDIGESKDLIDEAAISGRERRLDRAIELVQQSKSVLMGRIDNHLSQTIGQLNDDMKVAREFGGDISRASTYLQELARARSAKDIEAAFVYVDKVESELVPITGRYNDARKKVSGAKQFIADCELFLVDTKEARRLLGEATKAFELKDFDNVDIHVKGITDTLNRAIPPRMNEEMVKAKSDLVEAKASKGVNITPMLTVLKSATSLMKSGDYPQAIREMREFKSMMKELD